MHQLHHHHLAFSFSFSSSPSSSSLSYSPASWGLPGCWWWARSASKPPPAPRRSLTSGLAQRARVTSEWRVTPRRAAAGKAPRPAPRWRWTPFCWAARGTSRLDSLPGGGAGGRVTYCRWWLRALCCSSCGPCVCVPLTTTLLVRRPRPPPML